MLRHCVRPLLALLLLVAGEAAATAQQPRTRYTLHAELAPSGGVLEARMSIAFVNTAQAPVGELVLHLYPNAFEGPKTVFAREGGFALRGAKLDDRGFMALLELETARGEDLLASSVRELVPDDHTQMRVALPSPVAPGATLELRARFRVVLPSLVARMGQVGDFCMLGQWFPKLAKLLPDGSFRSTPYHGVGEFDADFADYDVELRVPAGFVIAAPGVARTASDARARRYVLEQARDFAWAAAPDLIHRASGARPRVEVFAPRGYGALAQRQTERASRWLAQLSTWLTPYPYARLVIVIPPRAAHGAAGMEYAGLVTGWSARPHAALPGLDLEHDFVTAHELAHQWFPMLVGSDEVAHPTLDEGLAQWLGLTLLDEARGRAFFDRWFGVPANAFDASFAMLAASGGDFPFAALRSSLDAAPQLSPRELGLVAYARPAVVLEAIAARHGRTRVLAALRRYARAHRFGHVTPDDLGAAFDAELGAGFAALTLMPALRGEPSTLAPHTRSAPRAPTAPLFSRALALVQYALGWLGP
jgi:hypothetical protein